MRMMAWFMKKTLTNCCSPVIQVLKGKPPKKTFFKGRATKALHLPPDFLNVRPFLPSPLIHNCLAIKKKLLLREAAKTSPESGKRLRMRTLMLNFFLLNQNLKVWKLGLIIMDKELHSRMTNETITKLL